MNFVKEEKMSLTDMVYDKDYFECGEEKKISCYTNYHWMPTRTLTTASVLIRRANITIDDTILDYGCAKGFLVKAFYWLGYDAFGTDTSKYALKTADAEIKSRLFLPRNIPEPQYDIVIGKDILEHIPYENINGFLKNIFSLTKKKNVFVIPLGDRNGKYVIPRFELDKTHIIKEPQDWWLEQIKIAGGTPINFTDDVKDIKPNWNVPNGNLYVESVVHK